jgi:hypothetical protein
MKIQTLSSAIFLFFIIGTTTVSNAQRNSNVTPFQKGTVTANLGVGFGTDYKGDYRSYNSGSGLGTKAALEFGIWQAGPGVVSLGAEIGGTFSGSRSGPNNDFKARTLVIAGRSAWHYGWKVGGLDTYAGVSAGAGFHHYNFTNTSNNGNTVNKVNSDDVIPVFGAFVGASYFFTPNFGVNIEGGYDITALQAGVVFKLR